ncbi:MAG: hypothetical protein ACKVHE_34030 [Planctomycetales bacterium]
MSDWHCFLNTEYRIWTHVTGAFNVTFHRTLLLTFLTFCLVVDCRAADTAPRKPNILIILADDHSYLA